MKTIRLPLILMIAAALLMTGCDSRTLLNALLGPGPDDAGSGADGSPPQPPAIVTATPSSDDIVVTATPQADGVVNARRTMNMRYGPSTAFGVVAVLERGDAVMVLGRNRDVGSNSRVLWLKARTETGIDGWVAGWLVDLFIDLDTVPVIATPIPPATSTPLPTSTPVPTFTPSGPIIQFWADNTNLPANTCTVLHWRTQNIRELYLDGVGVTGSEDRTVCPPTTTTYTLRVVRQDWSVEERYVTVQTATQFYIDFRADSTALTAGECTTIRWDVEGVKAVHFEGAGVIGHSTAQVCPAATATYTLSVTKQDDSTEMRKITITVS